MTAFFESEINPMIRLEDSKRLGTMAVIPRNSLHTKLSNTTNWSKITAMYVKTNTPSSCTHIHHAHRIPHLWSQSQSWLFASICPLPPHNFYICQALMLKPLINSLQQRLFQCCQHALPTPPNKILAMHLLVENYGTTLSINLYLEKNW